MDFEVAFVRASDMGISAAELEGIWHAMGAGTLGVPPQAHRVLDAVARNPNLPIHLAPACLGKQAAALAANPALPLLLQRNPEFVLESSVSRLLRTVRRLDTPVEILQLLSQHFRPLVADAARLHVRLAGEVPEGAWEVLLHEELAALPVGGRDWLQELHAWGLVPEWLAERHHLKATVRPALPRLPAPDTEIAQMPLETLALRYRSGALEPSEFLSRPDLPDDLVRALVAEELAASCTTRWLVLVLAVAGVWTEALLHECALSTNWLRRLGAAMNEKTPEKDLRRLRNDANRLVRAVATSTPSAGRGSGRPGPHRSA
jgi:hypothetical protein